MRRAFSLLALSLFLAPQLCAADLSKIERTIRKEPAYQSKTPRYCLLVFGPEANTRIWLVLDGKTLYVDRNGNGDLTEDGEKVIAKKGLEIVQQDKFEVDEIRDGIWTHKNLVLSVHKADHLPVKYPHVKQTIARLPEGRSCSLLVDVELPGWKGKGDGGRTQQVAQVDAHGILSFAEKPQDAPIIHFGGPWQIQCHRPIPLRVGREDDLFLSLGTPGLGEGTTAHLLYDGTVPENVFPRVEITYPPAKAGEPPLKRLYELKERC